MGPVATGSTSELVLPLRGAAGTRALGRRLASALGPGDFVGLSGELGAGKTTLVRALCEALGVPRAQIASPTFAIVHPYEGARLRLWHADLYRLGSADELFGTGFFDLLGTDAVVLVEWLDRVPEAAPRDWLEVVLEHVSPKERRVRLVGHGARGAALVEALRARHSGVLE